MSKHKNLKRNLLICLLAGSAVMYTLPLHAATSVVANNALPQNGQFFNGNEFIQGTANEKGNGFDFADIGSITKPNDLTMNVHQNNQNAVIKWGSFDVGGSATVNFTAADAFKNNFNTLNYVNSGSASQIYGTINGLGGNIYVVNTAGVQIGPSAQINVGSLYVSNNVLDDSVFNNFVANADNANFDLGGKPTTYTDAALMSLGNINANNVTFEGNGRIVIDSERIKNENTNLTADEIFINTNDKNNVVIGYEAYENGSYAGVDKTEELATLNGNGKLTKADGYMWVEDVNQLQAINTNLGGNYALRNSIDATATDNGGEGFNPIGLDTNGKVIVNVNVNNNKEYGFTGNFDGLDYNIFGLTINRENEANVGLFGVAHNANINNVTLVGGSITGGSVVGSVVGAALGNTHITNATNSASVTGNTDVGGIVGYSGDEISDGDNGNIIVNDTDSHFANLVNTGTVHSKGEESNENGGIVSNAGGLIGYMYNGKLDGNSYNLGDVSGKGYNVGGLVGHAVNSTIGDGTNLVYNRLDVEGAYNVGGIVGNMDGTTVQNAENSGNITATGYETEKYIYNTANTDFDKTHGENNDGVGGVEVNVANVGGIAGNSSNSSTIENVTNTGNVNSNTDTYEHNHTYYTAGNVGGVVGRAENTNITNATNRENEVRGAHNVGGVAGYFSGIGTVDGGINDGGDIMATGARAAAGVNGNVVNEAGFAREQVRPGTVGDETFIIGNMGGVVGYMDGDNVYVTGSANRGTVHSEDITDPGNILYISQAANTGGIVGKINRNKITDGEGNILTNEAILAGIKEGSITAAVTDSYNTGDVTGYSGVGGVVGMMYNGEVADSYNLGSINTTRKPKGGDRTSVNMGGVVGDTTEGSGASAVIYNVYNKGQIGDDDYETYARHVGGIVGRLSGIVDKSYNTGAIYNGYSVVGGIAGWFYEGTISNSFNTGNITVLNKETAEKAGSQVGGIAGGMSAYGNNGTNFIYNAYNLGTLRSFNTNNLSNPNSVGGIVGKLVGAGGADTNVSIRNVYTTSNIYSGTDGETARKDSGAGSIYGDDGGIGGYLHLAGANYIELGNSAFNNLEGSNPNVNKVNYEDRYNSDAYEFVKLKTNDKIWADVGGANVSEDGYWRIYNNGDGTGTTPILNAFLPNAEDYFSGETGAENPMEGISSIQYGTAYDPLLTIIKANEDLTFDWGALGIQNDGGLAVYNAGLTLTDFKANGGTGYFGGIIYADESLNLKGTDDIGLGSASQIYGSDVAISTDGKVTIYGDITATGNQKDGDTTGGITINAGDVDVYGTLTSAKNGVPTKVGGIAQGAVADFDFGEITDKDKAVTDIGNRFAVDVNSSVTGDITINAGTKVVTGDDGKSETVTIGDGNVNLYYGNKQEGLITTGGDLTVTGTGDVYVDSDLDIGGDLTLTGNGANSEVVLDLTNIGQVQSKNGTVDDAATGLHNFMHHFSNTDGANINLKAEKSKDTKITVDMWDGKTFNLKKFDSNGHDFKNELDSMNVTINGNKLNGTEGNHVKDYTYIWVSDGEQLQGINNTGADGLDFNYALKGDINASDVQGYEAIGGTTGFTGTFDGRGNRIIGLEVDNEINAGIFSKINQTGTVKNLNVYSGTFTGTDTAGAVAGINNGTIENITAFGNTVTVTGNDGNAGGIAGTNSGIVDDVESSGSVIGEGDNAIVGGLVGTNEKVNNESKATISNSYSNSAVTSTSGTNAGLGGVVGVNEGTVSLVDSLGVTNGTNSTNVGGVIGINNGTLSSAYNESIVNGNSNVGGIIGTNGTYTVNDDTITWTSRGTVSNIVNATSVTGGDETADNVSEYVGGLVGINGGSIENGRNNGTITGTKYVGGMVGSNAQGATLTNLVNDSSAAIEGENYVGGIAGTNAGTITAQNQSNLINRGSITGQNYVGGVAGENIGTIEYVKNDVNLYVKDDTKIAQYFGGVAGVNGRVDDTSTTEDETATGTITSATNEGDVVAENAQYVGGIVGWNTVNGTLDGMGNSNTGRVEGATYVGGVAGKNDADITGTADNIITIENTGVVIAHKGGAGGIFGENTGDIQYAEMSNSGIVSGTNYSGIDDVTNGTGGIIGVNSGDIIYSSLKNEADGQVIGMENVGGLIGYNSGEITGGRTEVDDTDAGYYKYQIYNNGVINAGKWVDGDNSNEEGYGVIDSGEFTAATVNDNSKNIGGLIGNNADATSTGGKKGSLTAGYNTGAIYASGSINVGGIAGSNSGAIDQVFNTVMTEDGKNQTITGGTNVGGLVGENTNNGTLSNAYNTTEVVGKLDNAIVGNAVGVNNDNATVSNVYDVTNTNNKLIGENSNGAIVDNSYTSAKQEESADGITYISADEAKDKESYKNFADGTWKFYDGYSNPLLSVFLTKVKVNQDKVNEYMNKHKVYNGSMQELTAADIKNLIESGAIYVNGLTKEEAFEAFNNNNSLISSIGYKDVGEHSNWLYSGQIASGSQDATFNPNNLGYDIALTASLAKKELSISDILANIVYGGNTYTDIAGGSLTGIINNDDVYLSDKNGNKISITSDLIADYLSGDYAENKGNRNTADVKRDQNNNVIAYEDAISVAISVDGISLGGTASGNYKLTDTTISGDITVTPATLNITLNDIYRIYGDHKTIYSNYDATQTGDYGIKNVSELVNGDQDSLNELIVTAISDGALDDFENPTKTNDVTKDGYKWTGEFSGIDNVNSNYTITVDGGNSIVKAKTITIKDLLASIVYGNQDGKGLQINTGASLADGSIVYGDDLDVSLVTDNAKYTIGGAYEDNKGGRTTADVGEYTNSLFVSGLSLTGDKAGNYDLDTTAAVGDIEVTKANLIINVGNAETVYGDAFNDNDYTHTLNGVTNGDSDTVIDGLLGGNYDNTVAVETGKDTANAGTYKDALGFVNYQQLKNYDVQVENGDVIINKKQITIGVNDEQILVGETPNYSGTDIQEQLVNGDIISDDIYHYGVSADTDVNVAGEHNIGIYINGTYYELQNPDWSSENGLGFFANYNVTFEPGTLTVSAYDIPEDWPHNRWDYLFNDAPFDRNKDFRERKAEVNFVDGGMEI